MPDEFLHRLRRFNEHAFPPRRERFRELVEDGRAVVVPKRLEVFGGHRGGFLVSQAATLEHNKDLVARHGDRAAHSSDRNDLPTDGAPGVQFSFKLATEGGADHLVFPQHLVYRTRLDSPGALR